MSATDKIAAPAIGRSQCPRLKPDWIELQRIIPLPEAARLSGMSVDTIKRRHGGKIVHISPRRRGMRLGDALTLTA